MPFEDSRDAIGNLFTCIIRQQNFGKREIRENLFGHGIRDRAYRVLKGVWVWRELQRVDWLGRLEVRVQIQGNPGEGSY